MIPVQQHLLVNHLPIISVILGTVILIIGMFFHLKQVKIVGLSLFIFSAILFFPSMYTGGKTEHVIGDQPGVARYLIEEHEEIAERAEIIVDVLAVFALISILTIITDKKISKWLIRITLIISLVSLYFVIQTGHSGGQIRRPELRTEN
ncbi:MAG: hypothetical protein RI952_389 [Bacteroidota bacterium]|jgi:hypothetical protein